MSPALPALAPVTRALTRFQKVPFAVEGAVLVAILLVVQAFPNGLTGGAGVAGVVGAAPLVLNAIGLVLVFRANRFLNFAQVQVGLFGAALFDALYRGQLLLHSLDSICSCTGDFPGPLGVRGRNSENSLIREKLGWAPSQTLRAGLEKTYEWVEWQVRRNA